MIEEKHAPFDPMLILTGIRQTVPEMIMENISAINNITYIRCLSYQKYLRLPGHQRLQYNKTRKYHLLSNVHKQHICPQSLQLRIRKLSLWCMRCPVIHHKLSEKENKKKNLTDMFYTKSKARRKDEQKWRGNKETLGKIRKMEHRTTGIGLYCNIYVASWICIPYKTTPSDNYRCFLPL